MKKFFDICVYIYTLRKEFHLWYIDLNFFIVIIVKADDNIYRVMKFGNYLLKLINSHTFTQLSQNSFSCQNHPWNPV